MKKKEENTFNSLIANKGFRDWVIKPNKESNQFWNRWIREHPSQFKDVQKAREFIERIKYKREKLSDAENEELLGKIIRNEKSTLRSKAKLRKKFSEKFNQWLKVAAILLFTIVMAVLTNMLEFKEEKGIEPPPIKTEWKVFENPRGQKSKVTLPDGTMVNLNYESTLKFPVKFIGEVRKVELTGEAFFEVVPNDTLPFVVQTGQIETEVLGTSFNINSFEWRSQTNISLVTGKVKVKPFNKAAIYLSPGEQLTFSKDSKKTAIKKFNISNTLAWKDGIILFKDAGLEQFIEQLERWYGVNFQVYGEPNEAWKINGRYQNERLDNILIGLQFVYDLEFNIQGKNVTLKFK